MSGLVVGVLGLVVLVRLLTPEPTPKRHWRPPHPEEIEEMAREAAHRQRIEQLKPIWAVQKAERDRRRREDHASHMPWNPATHSCAACGKSAVQMSAAGRWWPRCEKNPRPVEEETL